jgi:steroid delta-isomerase-like uncharacterized protein
MLALFARREMAWRKRDFNALAADYAEDCSVDSPFAGVMHGREAARHVFEQFFDAFADLTFTTEEVLIDGTRAILLARVAGTHTGPFFHLPPSGRRFDILTVWFHDVKDGRIVRERRIYDFTGFLIQVGVLKAKPAG